MWYPVAEKQQDTRLQDQYSQLLLPAGAHWGLQEHFWKRLEVFLKAAPSEKHRVSREGGKNVFSRQKPKDLNVIVS